IAMTPHPAATAFTDPCRGRPMAAPYKVLIKRLQARATEELPHSGAGDNRLAGGDAAASAALARRRGRALKELGQQTPGRTLPHGHLSKRGSCSCPRNDQRAETWRAQQDWP